MNMDELNELDLSEIGEFPLVIKLIIVLFLCAGIGGGVYYYDIQHQFKALAKVEAQEKQLKREFEDKQAKADIEEEGPHHSQIIFQFYEF